MVWRDAVHRAGGVDTGPTRRGSPSRAVSFAFSLARIAVEGTYGTAGRQASKRAVAAAP